jgi:hypothetical protein
VKLEAAQTRTVDPETRKAYNRHWGDWLGYITKLRDPLLAGDPYLRHLREDKTEQAARIALFGLECRAKAIAQSEKNPQDRVRKALSALRFHFTVASHDVSCFDTEILEKMRKGPKFTPQELRDEMNRRTVRATLLTCPEMILDMREELFVATDHTTRDGIDSQSTYCGCAIATDKGYRVCIYTLQDGEKADHCMRANSVQVVFVGGATMTVGLAMYAYMDRNPKWCGKSVTFNHASSKTGPQEPAAILSRGPHETQLVQDLITYWRRAGTLPQDELFTRYYREGQRVDRKVLRRKDVTAAFKRFAVRAGVPADRISSKSARLGANAHLRLAGVPAAERHENGRWAKDSKVPARHYDVPIQSSVEELPREVNARGVFAMMDMNNAASGLTAQHVRDLAARGSI